MAEVTSVSSAEGPTTGQGPAEQSTKRETALDCTPSHRVDDLLQLHNVLNPITALTFLKLDRLYLLAGEGQFLRLFDHETKELLKTLKVFDEHVIHGIVCHQIDQGFDADDSWATLLVWGAGYVSVLELIISHGSIGTDRMHINVLLRPVNTGDWILDASFINPDTDELFHRSTSIWAFLVNSHNKVILLRLIIPRAPEEIPKHTIQVLTSGPPSMLYSAHIFPTSTGCVLIAGGTFFGEVLLWSFLPGSYDVSRSVQYRIFRGHQGSVFGVQISEKVENGALQRLLASCSDDRTIRIWDISDVSKLLRADEVQPSPESGFHVEASEADSVYSVAKGMGHASRIWGLRFLGQKNENWGLISFGEDATAQTWLMHPKASEEDVPLKSNKPKFELQHLKTYRYHSGKNIHAITVCQHSMDNSVIATGGADGQVNSYDVAIDELNLRAGDRSHQFGIQDVYDLLPNGSTINKSLHVPPPEQSQPQSGHIFHTLSGDWQISRIVRCKLKSENCGNFEGIATLTPRYPTDDSYDGEALYSETGLFTTTVGMELPTSRQYVWRLKRLTQTIELWFVKVEDKQSVDNIFHALDFPEDNSKSSERPRNTDAIKLTASGNHVCEPDNYQFDYTFHVENLLVTQWTSIFTVSGPNKDYVTQSAYTPKAESVPHHDNERANKHLPTPEPESKKLRLSKQPETTGGHSRRSETDSFKTFCWLNESEFLVSTDIGVLLLGMLQHGRHDVPLVSYRVIAREKNLESSCIATSVRSPALACLTGNEGSIYLYHNGTRTLNIILKLPSKVAYLQAETLPADWGIDSSADSLGSDNKGVYYQVVPTRKQKVGMVATRLWSSSISVMLFEVAGARPSTELKPSEIKIPADFVVTSSLFVKKKIELLILGSRNGDLGVCNISRSLESQLEPMILRVSAHEESVTSIVMLADEHVRPKSSKIHLVTTGRDGRYKVHELSVGRPDGPNGDVVPQLKTVHDCKLPFGPFIEGASFSLAAKELLLWGFRSKEFVAWNESQRVEVLSVECGNAHRNWDYVPHVSGAGGGSLVWTQAKLCHVHSQDHPSHRVIDPGGHGREIKAMALSPLIQAEDNLRSRWLATGAEDTIIRLFDCKPTSEPGSKCSAILKRHTTGIQQLRWSKDGRRLFSAAGCEEFIVWYIRPVPRIGLGVICEAECPKVTEFSDLRIMDFDVIPVPHAKSDPEAGAYLLTIAYSDSSLRLFLYRSWRTQKFLQVFTGSCGTNCLTQARALGPVQGNDLYVCTASTNGSLDLWLLGIQQLLHETPLIFEETPQWKRPLVNHASSIKCFDVFDLSPTESLVISGGDGGSVAFTNMRYSQHASQKVLIEHTSTIIQNHHASAITGLKCMHIKQYHTEAGLLFASVGSDQRLKLSKVHINERRNGPSPIGCITLTDVYTGVGDAAALEYCEDEGLIVAGVGTETWRVGSLNGLLQDVDRSLLSRSDSKWLRHIP